jgi:hypothetical protein
MRSWQYCHKRSAIWSKKSNGVPEVLLHCDRWTRP